MKTLSPTVQRKKDLAVLGRIGGRCWIPKTALQTSLPHELTHSCVPIGHPPDVS